MNIPNTFPVPENPKIYHIVHIGGTAEFGKNRTLS